MNILIILIVLVTIIYYFLKIKNKDFNNRIEEKETMFPLEKLKKLKLPKKFEINNLEKVDLQLFFRYGDSNNHLYNDGRKIFQECIEFLKNRAIINGYRFGLSKILFSKSILKWYDQKIGLELRLIHSSVESQLINIFIIPLNLVDLRKETFQELSKSKKIDNGKLNTLITRVDQIPSYLCCTANRGPIVNFNLCPVATLLLNQPYFFKYQMTDKITFYITKPQPFDRTIGLNIRDKLSG